MQLVMSYAGDTLAWPTKCESHFQFSFTPPGYNKDKISANLKHPSYISQHLYHKRILKQLFSSDYFNAYVLFMAYQIILQYF